MGTGASGAATALQNQINATQALDGLTYGIRAAETGGIYGSCAAYRSQIDEAITIAEWRLHRGIGRDLRLLKLAKKAIAGDLAAAKAALRNIGSKRQLKLALA